MVLLNRALAAAGVFALTAVASGTAFAQGYDVQGPYHHRPGSYVHVRMDRWPMDRESARRELQVLHRVYYHEMASGHPAAAMRAHMRAEAIRAHLRARHRDWRL